MINYYHLSDAMPVALIGMFVLWAAASRRHWFVRTAVVGAVLLVALLIPAYEVVMMLSIECALVIIGMRVWRRLRQRRVGNAQNPAPRMTSISNLLRFQLSMETMLLLVVVIAVVVAVVARAPQLTMQDYFRFIHVGTMAGVVCLACVWVVCGRAPWWIRLVALPMLPFLLACMFHGLSVAGQVAILWYNYSATSTLTEYLQSSLRNLGSVWYWTATFSIGMAILCAWLFLVRRARWFDPFREDIDAGDSEPRLPNSVRWARVGALGLFGLAAIFPLLLFYRLMTPPPVPSVELPNPNGYDDFIAAGNMIGQAAANKLRTFQQLTDDQLGIELANHNSAFARMHEGLSKPVMYPYTYKPVPQENIIAIDHLVHAVQAQAAWFDRRGNAQLQLENGLTLLKLAHGEMRGSPPESYNLSLNEFEWYGYDGIMGLLPRLSAEECIRVANELWDLDQHRESWETRLERQRIIDANSGWKNHVRSILQQWSGDEYKWARDDYFRQVVGCRVTIAALGIQAYLMDQKRLPEKLADLVPRYLPAVPDDPYGDGRIKYRVVAYRYMLYSNGPDDDDDGGKPLEMGVAEPNGDYLIEQMFPRMQQPRNP
jgi:hypothetical protein